MFDPKIVIEGQALYRLLWGGLVGVGVVITATVKVLTKDLMSKKEAYDKLQNRTMCDTRFKTLVDKIDTLDRNMTIRFDDIKDLINGKARTE